MQNEVTIIETYDEVSIIETSTGVVEIETSISDREIISRNDGIEFLSVDCSTPLPGRLKGFALRYGWSEQEIEAICDDLTDRQGALKEVKEDDELEEEETCPYCGRRGHN
jgi:hypothetical protein